jgi:hypothetical protein
VNPNPTHATYHALLAEAYQRSRHPVRLLGSGVRFAETSKDEPSGQQLLSLDAS